MMPGAAELWLLCGLILLGLELAAPGAFMMWIGLACLGAGGVTLLVGPGFGWQVVAFALFCAASLAVGLRLRRRPARSEINTPASGLVGRSAFSLGFAAGEGRVRVGDSDWSARLAEGARPPVAAEPLDVVGVAGTVLVVRPRVVMGEGWDGTSDDPGQRG
jgi:membrane protein implicated in regulation of membrane protease activity